MMFVYFLLVTCSQWKINTLDQFNEFETLKRERERERERERRERERERRERERDATAPLNIIVSLILITFQNWNKKPLTRSKDHSENLSFKLLRDVVFLSLPGQLDISCITMSNFQSHEYPWKPNLSNHIKFILTTSN